MKLEEMKKKVCHLSMTYHQANCIGKLCMACKEEVHPEYICAAIFKR